jgi:hypothetical protein
VECSADIISQALGLLFDSDGELADDVACKPLIFAISSSIMGLVVVILDVLAFYVAGRSYLKLRHGFPLTLLLILVWGIGAGLGGLLGGAFGIFQLNRIASVVAGVGWPLILPRVIKNVSEKGESLQDEEEEEEESE